MKFLVDMNLSPRWADKLAHGGYQAVHWSSVGPANASDPAIMDYARKNNFVVLTYDLDFGAILAATGGNKPSVVQIRGGNINAETASAHVIAALKQMREELDRGALLSIDPSKNRLRLLPLETDRA